MEYLEGPGPDLGFDLGSDLETAAVPKARLLGLRDVPWRWRDAFIGIVPLLAAYSMASVLAKLRLLDLARALVFPLTGVVMAWMLTYPLVVARRYGVTPRLPRLRSV